MQNSDFYCEIGVVRLLSVHWSNVLVPASVVVDLPVLSLSPSPSVSIKAGLEALSSVAGPCVRGLAALRLSLPVPAELRPAVVSSLRRPKGARRPVGPERRGPLSSEVVSAVSPSIPGHGGVGLLRSGCRVVPVVSPSVLGHGGVGAPCAGRVVVGAGRPARITWRWMLVVGSAAASPSPPVVDQDPVVLVVVHRGCCVSCVFPKMFLSLKK